MPAQGTGDGTNQLTAGEVEVGPGEQKDLDFVDVTPGSGGGTTTTPLIQIKGERCGYLHECGMRCHAP
jgi:hypothetical protein